MSAEHESIPPWYKQFWPWFLIGLLASSVTFSLVYLTLSIRYYDGSVSGDYYKQGLAINQQLAKQEHAQTLGLEARLLVDDRTGDVVVDLQGDRQPEQLFLELIFPTESSRDRSLTLEHVRDGRYVGMVNEPLNYRWYLQLQPTEGRDAEWRLTGEARFPSDDEIALVPGL
ncbi:FixH family protein [Halomonas sp. ATCH28]|uniref:FixH family protein n=1 Tax=Halomonas gemina TaxID=2945105 RepID=A0ABT0SYN8_9GAMM|nr:FixH family protein [Halomonas gemina]MCL7939780.1 FixH family protein [Halomonas gemina]